MLRSCKRQMSLLLSRPPIINDNSCSFELPRIPLENPDSLQELPSPIAHMVLQCQLGRSICKIPDVASGLLSPTQADTIQQEVGKWLASFPSAYRVADPDMKWDEEYHYVALQRCQLHVVGYMTMLAPLKCFSHEGCGFRLSQYGNNFSSQGCLHFARANGCFTTPFRLHIPRQRKVPFRHILDFRYGILPMLCSHSR